MREFLQQWLHSQALSGWQYLLVVLAWMLLVGVVVLGFVATFAGVTSWVERRIAGRMMSRIGPNRVGPQGILQWLMDGIKCFLKEDIIAREVDRRLFRLAPYPVFVGTFMAFAALPFGARIAAVDLNVGILFLISVTSLVPVGLLMAGWSSNNKWSLLGGVRSAAQIVSYEIPTGLTILTIVVMAGSLSMQTIIGNQGGLPWQWYVTDNPFAFVAFFIFFIASLAEGNRTPFDLPEAESELVSGYNTEYSGMRFLFFLFAEWANLWVAAAVAVTLFLGGWQVPFIDSAEASALHGWQAALYTLGSVAIFFAKTSVGVFIIIWLRWTLPRLRVDQLMAMCWKYLVPFGFVCVLGASAWTLLPYNDTWQWVRLAVSVALTGIGLLLIGAMFVRAIFNLRQSGARLYLKIWT